MVNRLERLADIEHGRLPESGEWPSGPGIFLSLSSQCLPELYFAQVAARQSPGWEANLREAAERMAETLKIRHEFLRLQGQVARQERELAALKRASGGITVPIQTFEPEPYVVLKPFLVTVQPCDDEFMASFFDANVSAMGDNEGEAVENLKGLILDLFDSLRACPKTRALAA